MALDAFKNGVKTTVSTGYDAAATSIVLNTGDGAKLPAASFNAVWFNSTDYGDPSDDPNVEIVRVTAISTDTLTITRAAETMAGNSTAQTHNTAGKTYKLIPTLTAKTLNTDLATVGTTNRLILSTVFETIGRFNQTASNSATLSFSAYGCLFSPGSTGYLISQRMPVIYPGCNKDVFAGSPNFSTRMYLQALNAASGSSDQFFGLGVPTISATTGITWTDKHIGFKLVIASGSASLYATQANGTTETASSALTTFADGDSLDLSLQVNGTSSVDYYWSKNGSAWSSVNLTTNMPTPGSAGSNTTDSIAWQSSDKNSGLGSTIRLLGAHYGQ